MGPKRYEFRISGLLPESVRTAFDDMQVGDSPAQTIIRGPVDGAGLSGVLALVRDLGLQIVSVRRLPDAPPPVAHPVQVRFGAGTGDRLG